MTSGSCTFLVFLVYFLRTQRFDKKKARSRDLRAFFVANRTYPEAHHKKPFYTMASTGLQGWKSCAFTCSKPFPAVIVDLPFISAGVAGGVRLIAVRYAASQPENWPAEKPRGDTGKPKRAKNNTVRLKDAAEYGEL